MEQIEHGFCDICGKEVDFRIDGEYLRDHFVCTQCNSLPRQRAFIHVLRQCCPDWQTVTIHESSPGGPSSDLLYRQAKNYTFSHYYPDLPSGTMGPEGAVCQNLETMSFEDNSFDLFLTQDVMEHVFDINAAFNEVKRVLKPGGIYLFTVPCYKDLPETFCRASMKEDGTVEYHADPVYHGNPVDEHGALVTWDYGRDFPDFVYRMCGMRMTVYRVESRYRGLDGELMEVFLLRKPPEPVFAPPEEPAPAPAPEAEAKAEEPAPEAKPEESAAEAKPEEPVPAPAPEAKAEEPAPAPTPEPAADVQAKEVVSVVVPVPAEAKAEEPAPAPAPEPAAETKPEEPAPAPAPEAKAEEPAPAPAPEPAAETKPEEPAPAAEKRPEEPASASVPEPVAEAKPEEPAPAPVEAKAEEPAPAAEPKQEEPEAQAEEPASDPEASSNDPAPEMRPE